MIGLTRKQSNCLAFIKRHIADAGVPPSFQEIADHMDLRSKSGVHRIIMALEERGLIRRLRHRARAIEVIDPTQGDLWFLSQPVLEWVQFGANRRSISAESLISEIVTDWARKESVSTRRPLEQVSA